MKERRVEGMPSEFDGELLILSKKAAKASEELEAALFKALEDTQQFPAVVDKK
jgi:hypothetical protein